ncbi:PBP1A family penicillin-binding protein [bacterium]|nr:PBP1A family penicillin-binding protein [bacterium]
MANYRYSSNRYSSKRNKRKRKKENSLLNFIIMFFIMCFAGLVAFYTYLVTLPPITNFDVIKPNQVTSIYSSDGEIIKTFAPFKFKKVEIENVPQDLKNAIIATEDKNFYKHSGFDVLGLIRSTLVNIRAGEVKQGASTITQQLARILFLSNERTFDRKIKELIIASRIEKTITKEEILEMYLNAVYLGSGAYGVQSASETYFDKNLDELTLAEMALIAGLPQAPSVYTPLKNPDLAIKRRNQVLKRMYKTGRITKEQFEKAKQEKLNLSKKASIYSYNKAPYLVDYVLTELEYLGFTENEISQGGLKIYTTVEYEAQNKAQEAVADLLANAGLTQDKTQGALFSFSPITGRIYAYVGGKNYGKTQYDRVTNAIRPPGSAFKPFVYATAVQQGLRHNDILEDTPLEVGKWAPKNYGGKYREKIPAWLALAVSSNVCAVRTIQKTGINSVISLVRDLGITTPLQNDMTIALGSNGVKLYDMVVAYGAFANGGFRVRPYSVERVENSRGVVIYENQGPKIAKVLAYETASEMTYMLKKVIEKGTGRGANIGREAAGKTGTTDDYRDAWFVGYTPEIVTGVWIGNDDNSKLGGHITGGSIPARIWAAYMRVATKNSKIEKFDYPILNEEDKNSDVNIEEKYKAKDEKEREKEKEDKKLEKQQRHIRDEKPEAEETNVLQQPFKMPSQKPVEVKKLAPIQTPLVPVPETQVSVPIPPLPSAN